MSWPGRNKHRPQEMEEEWIQTGKWPTGNTEFRKKSTGAKGAIKGIRKIGGGGGSGFWNPALENCNLIHLKFLPFFLSYMELLNLVFGSAGFFAEYKIICLRLDSRVQNLSGVNASHFILTEKLLQQSLFSVYEAELLKHVNSSVLIAVLLVRLSSSSAFASYCFVPFSCGFVREVTTFHWWCMCNL